MALFVGRDLDIDEHALVEASNRGVRASAEGEGRTIDVEESELESPSPSLVLLAWSLPTLNTSQTRSKTFNCKKLPSLFLSFLVLVALALFYLLNSKQPTAGPVPFPHLPSLTKMVSPLTYLTVAPTAKHTATVVFAHGLGDSGAGWYVLCPLFISASTKEDRELTPSLLPPSSILLSPGCRSQRCSLLLCLTSR